MSELDCRAALGATLLALGITDAEHRAAEAELVAYAPPELKIMAATYHHVNTVLEDERKRTGLGRVWHVTGEARVLVDPAHRRILRRRAGTSPPAEIACYADRTSLSAAAFVGRQRRHWSVLAWQDLVDLLDLGARRALVINLLPNPQNIHFSLFSDRYLLLQNQHHHPTEEKWVWFLRSCDLVERLVPSVQELMKDTPDVLPTSFEATLKMLSEYETITIAEIIKKGEFVEEGASRLSNLDVDVNHTVSTLVELGLAVRSENALCLTQMGEQWLRDTVG